MVEEQGEIFNKVNTSTALHRIAKIATAVPDANAGAKQQSPDAVLSMAGSDRYAYLLQMATRCFARNEHREYF